MLETSQRNKFYKVDEIADKLGVKKFVIRTWEKQFNLNRTGMQYSQEDLITFEAIRDMLYGEKLSPTLAKQQLPTILAQKAAQIQSQSATIIQEQIMEPTLTEVTLQAHQVESLAVSSESKIEIQEQAQEIRSPEIIELASESIAAKIVTEEQNAATIQDDIVGATLSPEVPAEDQVQPAFKQDQEFWNNIKSFKEQLLKIQEQLK